MILQDFKQRERQRERERDLNINPSFSEELSFSSKLSHLVSQALQLYMLTLKVNSASYLHEHPWMKPHEATTWV